MSNERTDNIIKTLGDELNRQQSDVKTSPQLIGNLSESIIALCDMIQEEFAKTAAYLRQDATVLRTRAAELDVRANDLDEASPTVRADIQKWTAYEEESRTLSDKLQVILKMATTNSRMN